MDGKTAAEGQWLIEESHGFQGGTGAYIIQIFVKPPFARPCFQIPFSQFSAVTLILCKVLQ